MRSWARHRFVAASSRRTEEKVASRRGSGRHCRKASRALLLSLRLFGRWVVWSERTDPRRTERAKHDSPKEAAHNVLEQPDRLLLHKLSDHVAQDRSNGVEPLVGRTYVRETDIVQQDLLHDEDGHCLAQFRAGFHDPKTQRDYFRRKQKVDDIRGIILDQRSDDAQRRETKVLKRTGL